RCLEDTRMEVLNEIMDWLLSSGEQNILWLHGVAGSGKSTIATTIAEYCREMSRLGAFLFFNRVDGAEGQLISIFRTIAFRLALFDSAIARHVDAAIQANNHAIEAIAEVQYNKLLLEPLTASRDDVDGPIVIVIDALDECGTPDARRTLMSLLKREFGKLPSNFRFLITSRPEADINIALSNRPSSVYEVALDSGSADSRRDVLRYIDYEMSRIINESQIIIPNNWSWTKQMERLADASEGLFIWASTVIKVVSESPSKFRKLNELVNASPVLKGLNQLYESMLRNSGVITMDDPSSIVRFQQVLGLVLLSRVPLSDITIDAILGLPPEEPSYEILSKLGSVLVFRRGGPVHVLHTSFADYLLSTNCSQLCSKYKDPSERLSDPWFINNDSQQSLIATRCFIVMKEELHFNMCNLESSFIYNSNVVEIEERINKKVPLHLQYACKYWADHLTEAPYSRELLGALIAFAHKHLLYWFEVLSLLGQVSRIASRGLLDVAAWSETHDSSIFSFLTDASKLASAFSIPITESIPHIYISMLPLMKDDSEVAAHYSKRTSRMVEVDRLGTKRPPLWLKVLEGHADVIRSVAFSPDGKHVVSGSDDGTARMWDVESGEMVHVLFEEKRVAVTSVTFSPDGQRIAAGLWDSTVRIWGYESWQAVSEPLEGHTSGVCAVAFSLTGTHIASGSADTTVRVWDIENRSAVHILEGHTDIVRSVAFLPNENRIVSCSDDKTIRIWDVGTGQAVGEPFIGHAHTIWSVAGSPDGRQVVSGSRDRTLRVWDVDSGQVISSPFVHSNSVTSVAFSSDGTRVVSVSSDCTIVVWDVERGKISSGPYTGHANAIRSVAFSPDGSRIISGSDDKTVRLWDVSVRSVVPDISVMHTDAVMSVAFSPDGGLIASGSNDKTLRLWSASTGEVASAPFEGHEHFVYSVAFSPDGKRIVSGSMDESVIIWEVKSGEMTFKPLKGHSDTVYSVDFSPDGTLVVSGSYDKTIIIWSAKDGNMISRSEQVHKAAIRSVAFSPNGTLIASASVDNDVVIWNAEGGKPVSGPLKAPVDSTFSYFAPLAFSPDGGCIASRSSDNDIIIRDVQSGHVISGPLTEHKDTVMSVAFSPNGAYLVSGLYDRTVIVRDANNGYIVSELFEGHTSPVTCVAFSPDSSRIVSCSFDATARIW
ncbi:WD40 repeat-like protein, partial [Fomitiporia mediterranea MF3/22]|uniref:WD40 repeat-like protein n=1 Tax=Fomitiporia mediterranea (strain MF3/22) TaxID=694068 RepID=UPI000440906F